MTVSTIWKKGTAVFPNSIVVLQTPVAYQALPPDRSYIKDHIEDLEVIL